MLLISRNFFLVNFQHSFTKSFPVTLRHPNISMWVLQTVPYTFPDVLTRRICLTIKSLLNLLCFSQFSWPSCLIQRRYCCEKLDAHHCVKSFGGFSLKQDKQVSFTAEKLYTFLRITVSAAQIKPYINMDIYYKPFSTFFIWHGQKRFCLSKKHHHLSLSV